MDITRFTEYKTGTLTPIVIRDNLNAFAFEPNPLPQLNWVPDSSTWQLIADARDRVSTLNGISFTLPNPALLLTPLQKREAIKSNSIEGTFVTPEEMLLFEEEHLKKANDSNEKQKDWWEVHCYEQAMNSGCSRIERGDEIDSESICDLHRILLTNSRGKDKGPGLFRDTQVYVSSRYNPPPVSSIRGHMDNLTQYMKEKNGDPLVKAAITHYQFEAIHPFKDGNGRIGRLLYSLCIFKWLKHANAWLYMSEFFDKNRLEYYNRLFAVSTDGDWEEWVKFCLRGNIEQADLSIQRCVRLNELRKQYEDTIGKDNPRMSLIVRLFLSNPFITVSKLSQELNISYNTAKADIDKLCEHKILEPVSKSKRPIFYCALDIFKIAYFD
jgi:Fic family protein